jgi:hypothetical protein
MNDKVSEERRIGENGAIVCCRPRKLDAASKVHKYGDAYSARIRLMA